MISWPRLRPKRETSRLQSNRFGILLTEAAGFVVLPGLLDIMVDAAFSDGQRSKKIQSCILKDKICTDNELCYEDRNYQTKSEMLDELQMLLGGRVAEAIVLKDISSGASSDLQRATQLARKMVCQYGMSDRLGSMTFGHPEEEVFLGRDIAREKYSNEVAAVIDEEVHRLMDEAYKGAEKLLRDNMDKLVLIAETLMQKETLDGKQLKELMQQGYLTEDGPALQAAEPEDAVSGIV